MHDYCRLFALATQFPVNSRAHPGFSCISFLSKSTLFGLQQQNILYTVKFKARVALYLLRKCQSADCPGVYLQKPGTAANVQSSRPLHGAKPVCGSFLCLTETANNGCLSCQPPPEKKQWLAAPTTGERVTSVV